jgi:hypothetical protein
MEILNQSSLPIQLDFDEILEKREILFSDITEAVYMVKLKSSDDDIEAVIDLRLGAGLEWDAANTSLLAVIPPLMWDKTEVGTNYICGVGFKEVDSPNFIEAELSDKHFLVVPDFIRG